MSESAKPNGENSIILKSTLGSNSGSGRGLELLEWISDELTLMAEAFGEPLTEQRQEIYCSGLADVSQDQLRTAFRRARYELKWFPKLAELRELAGVLPETSADGRPGPEEAWARMPKGERAEEDSVVWCEEECVAYGACRSLLRVGDQIGARMAFKERYEKELAEARAQRKPVRWTMSAGYDIDHRLTTLANAVQERRMSLDDTLNFVPGERRDAFAQMLPSAAARGLLTGKASIFTSLPGLAGILAEMQMEGTVPEELKAKPRPRYDDSPELSDEDWQDRKKKLKAQIELIMRSRAESGNG